MTFPVVFNVLSLRGDDEKTGRLSTSAIADIKSSPGLKHVFFGRKKEDNQVGVLCTVWESPDTALAYSSNVPSSVDSTQTLAFELTIPNSNPLTAPCTEIFTAFGVEEGFDGNVARFVGAVDADKPKGYYGAAFGKEIGDGRAFRALLGWESVDAHVEAKGIAGGVIQRNIHEMREKRSSVDMFHVEFKEL